MVKVMFFSSKNYVVDSFTKEADESKHFFQFNDFTLTAENASLSKGFDVVCPFVNDKLDKKVLQILKTNGCKLIALRCAGYNNVDIQAAKNLGLPIVRVPEYSPYAVAEHAMSLICTLNRKIHKAYNRVRDNNFNIDGLLGTDLYGKTMGVIGIGKIGNIFIDIAKGFGMNILAYDLYQNKENAKQKGFKYVTLDELYKESDFIALHCPLTKDNYHLINKDSLSKMKTGVFIVNTSRGALVNAHDVVDSLKSGKVGAVALDVYEEEDKYFFEDFSNTVGVADDTLSRLITFPNVIITSHQAFFTHEALKNIASVTLNNIDSYIEKGELLNKVE